MKLLISRSCWAKLVRRPSSIRMASSMLPEPACVSELMGVSRPFTCRFSAFGSSCAAFFDSTLISAVVGTGPSGGSSCARAVAAKNAKPAERQNIWVRLIVVSTSPSIRRLMCFERWKFRVRQLIPGRTGTPYPFLLVAADANFKPGAEGEGQRRIADGTDVLVVQQVLRLREDGEAVGDGEGAAEIELGVAGVEIAVGQQQRIAEIGVITIEEGGVVAAAGVRAEEADGEP